MASDMAKSRLLAWSIATVHDFVNIRHLERWQRSNKKYLTIYTRELKKQLGCEDLWDSVGFRDWKARTNDLKLGYVGNMYQAYPSKA